MNSIQGVSNTQPSNQIDQKISSGGFTKLDEAGLTWSKQVTTDCGNTYTMTITFKPGDSKENKEAFLKKYGEESVNMVKIAVNMGLGSQKGPSENKPERSNYVVSAMVFQKNEEGVFTVTKLKTSGDVIKTRQAKNYSQKAEAEYKQDKYDFMKMQLGNMQELCSSIGNRAFQTKNSLNAQEKENAASQRPEKFKQINTNLLTNQINESNNTPSNPEIQNAKNESVGRETRQRKNEISAYQTFYNKNQKELILDPFQGIAGNKPKEFTPLKLSKKELHDFGKLKTNNNFQVEKGQDHTNYWLTNTLLSKVSMIFLISSPEFSKINIDLIKSVHPVTPQNLSDNINILESDDIRNIPIRIHVNGNHWTFAYIDHQKQTLEYYDSMSGKVPEGLNAATEALSKKFGKPYSIENKITKPCQQDSYECGPWNIYFMLNRISNPDVNFNELKEPGKIIANFRNHIIKSALLLQKDGFL